MKKKLYIFFLIIASICLLVCSCSKKSTAVFEEASNPFSSEAEAPEDDEYELYYKYQSGGIDYDYSVSPDINSLSYNGSPVEYRFLAKSSGDNDDCTVGYRAYLNGIPQQISIDGKEYSEFVESNLETEYKEISLFINPVITEELRSEKSLSLIIVQIFNSGYIPSGKFIKFDFGNIHNAGCFVKADLKINKPVENLCKPDYAISDNNISVTDEVVNRYNLSNAGKKKNGNLKIFSQRNETSGIAVVNGKAECELILDGADCEKYFVYEYVNHKNVKINGKDAVILSTENGKIPKTDITVEGVNLHDIVYFIAIPQTDTTDTAYISKTQSKVLLDKSELTNGNEYIPPETSQATESETPEKVPEETDAPDINNPIYSHIHVGYVDAEMKYEVVYKAVETEDSYDYIYKIIDTDTDSIIRSFDTPVPVTTSFGNGIFTATYMKEDISGDDSQKGYVSISYNMELDEVAKAEFSDDHYKPIFSVLYLKNENKYLVASAINPYTNNEVFTLDLYNCDGEKEKTVYQKSNVYFSEMLVASDVIALYLPDKNSGLFPQGANGEHLVFLDKDFNVLSEYTPDIYNKGHLKQNGSYIILDPYYWDVPEGYVLPDIPLVGFDIISRKIVRFVPNEKVENKCTTMSPDGKTYMTITEETVSSENGESERTQTLRFYNSENGELFNTIVYKKQRPYLWETARLYNDYVISGLEFGKGLEYYNKY